MDDQTDTSQFGPASPILDPIAKAYDRVRNVFKYIPGKAAPAQNADHQAAIDEMNKQANDKTVQDATKSFQKPAPAKPNLKPAPRKR